MAAQMGPLGPLKDIHIVFRQHQPGFTVQERQAAPRHIGRKPAHIRELSSPHQAGDQVHDARTAKTRGGLSADSGEFQAQPRRKFE